MPLDSFAARISVYLDTSAGTPPSGYTTAVTSSILRAAFREYEAHSEGHITFDGPFAAPTSSIPTGPGNIRVFWDSPSPYCAWSVVSCGVAPFQCSVALNPNSLGPATTPPQPNSGCRSLYTTFLHEFAHHFNQLACGGWHLEWVRDRYVWFDNCHSGGVLGYVMAADGFGGSATANWVDDMGASNLWNVDMEQYGITFGVQPRTTHYRFINQDGSGISYNASAVGNTNEAQNHTHAVSNGPSGSYYARAYALSRSSTPSDGIYYDRGDVYDGGAGNTTRVYTGGQTRRRVCVAADPNSSEVIVAYSSDFQYVVPRDSTMNILIDTNEIWSSPTNTDIYWAAGWRNVYIAESSNGGSSFGTPFALGYAYTKGGVGCSLDRSANRFAIVYEGAGENSIWIAHRSSAASSTWSNPYRIDDSSPGFLVNTLEVPQISFDSRSTNATGRIAWQETVTLDGRYGAIHYDASSGRYIFDSTGAHTALLFGGAASTNTVPVVATSYNQNAVQMMAQGESRTGTAPSDGWIETLGQGGSGNNANYYSMWSNTIGSARPLALDETVFVAEEFTR